MDNWYYLNQGATVGPLTRLAMEAMIRAGTVRPDTMVWPGAGEWVAASMSSLGPLFAGAAGGGGFVPPPPYMPSPIPPAKKDWLPQNKNARIAILAVIVIVGIYAMWDGIRDMVGGMGGADNPNARINIVGCQGTGPSSVQCGYQNVGMVKGRVCFDIVITCFDGPHRAATCSDPMEPGQASTQQVSKFKPDIQPTTQCSGMTYENARTRT